MNCKHESPLTGNLHTQEGSYHWENEQTFLGLILYEQLASELLLLFHGVSSPFLVQSRSLQCPLLLHGSNQDLRSSLGWVDSHLPSSGGDVLD